MAAGIKVTHEEAARRFDAAGYELRGEYRNQVTKVQAYCAKHNIAYEVFPGNIFKGQRLWCCGNEGRSVKHTGKVLSAETKEKLSAYRGEKHHQFGRPLPKETCDKVRDSITRLHRTDVDYAILRAANGKTSRRPGFFYIAAAGNGLLKFGSVHKMTPARRMESIRHDTGSARLLVLVHVDDAGAYEAAMMSAHRQHWSHGEFFNDFRSELPRAA